MIPYLTIVGLEIEIGFGEEHRSLDNECICNRPRPILWYHWYRTDECLTDHWWSRPIYVWELSVNFELIVRIHFVKVVLVNKSECETWKFKRMKRLRIGLVVRGRCNSTMTFLYWWIKRELITSKRLFWYSQLHKDCSTINLNRPEINNERLKKVERMTKIRWRKGLKEVKKSSKRTTREGEWKLGV